MVEAGCGIGDTVGNREDFYPRPLSKDSARFDESAISIKNIFQPIGPL
jgi:hypothetical protein